MFFSVEFEGQALLIIDPVAKDFLGILVG